MQSSKQFVNTLEDNTRFSGAMSKLISDYAQVEISNIGNAYLEVTTKRKLYIVPGPEFEEQ